MTSRSRCNCPGPNRKPIPSPFSGAPSDSIKLAVGPNAIPIVVTAQSGAKKTYIRTVRNNVASTTVTPTGTASVSVLTVNGKTVPSGQASDSIALGVGLNTISVLVTAQNGATRTYSIKITRIAKVVAVSAGMQGVTAVSAGYHHAIALREDGTLAAWGYNTYGQTVIPPAANP